MNTEHFAAPGYIIARLGALLLSQTNAQIERRKHFDKSAITELADSIKSRGLLQPIVVRPAGLELEIVAGERRYLAAKQAGLEEVPVNVRVLTDEEVLEVQLIENLQRTDVHPLHEAEGYEQLMKVHGHRAEELGDKVGKSKAYVYARLKLLALCKEARTAFYEGKLNPSTALLVARIANHDMQKQALVEITDRGGDDPMSTRDASQHIHESYMLRLADAPFPTDVDNYIRKTPACGACPKNSNAQPELFGDVKATSAGVCTDSVCYRKKAAQQLDDRAQKARELGHDVVSGTKAREIFPHGPGSYVAGGFKSLDSTEYRGGRFVKVKDLMKPDAKTTFVRGRHEGRDFIVEVIDEKALDKKVPKSKTTKSTSAPGVSAKDAATIKLNRRLFRAIFEKASATHREALEFLVGDTLNCLVCSVDDLTEALGWDKWKGRDFGKELANLSLGDLCRLARVAPLVEDAGSTHSSNFLENEAKKAKVDVAKIKKAIAAEEAAAKAAAPAKKKPAKKK